MTVEFCLTTGEHLAKEGDLHGAALSFCQALKLNPTVPETHQRLGEVLLKLKYFDDAQACFGKAIELQPYYPEAYNYLGKVLKNKNQFIEAEKYYRQAIEQRSDYAEAFHNLGNCLKTLNRLTEAEAAYQQALRLEPNLIDSQFALAILYLLQGQYDKGWKLYETRFFWQGKLRLDIPFWQGESLIGRHILLFYEQGLGDTLQFIRYVDKVAALASTTTLWVQEPLERLLTMKKNSFSVCSNSKDIDPKEFDVACSVLSLPRIFATAVETIPNKTPYLTVNSKVLTKWQKCFAQINSSRPKIGVVWAGNPHHFDDRNRSIPFKLFSQLFAIDHITWISLQVGETEQALATANVRVLNCAKELVDFAETAGVIETLDLVITVDTATAHLAGALGKKTWLLLPFSPDWRWGLARDDSPWYPSILLFRQQKLGDWQEVLEKVKGKLQSEFLTEE